MVVTDLKASALDLSFTCIVSQGTVRLQQSIGLSDHMSPVYNQGVDVIQIVYCVR